MAQNLRRCPSTCQGTRAPPGGIHQDRRGQVVNAARPEVQITVGGVLPRTVVSVRRNNFVMKTRKGTVARRHPQSSRQAPLACSRRSSVHHAGRTSLRRATSTTVPTSNKRSSSFDSKCLDKRAFIFCSLLTTAMTRLGFYKYKFLQRKPITTWVLPGCRHLQTWKRRAPMPRLRPLNRCYPSMIPKGQ